MVEELLKNKGVRTTDFRVQVLEIFTDTYTAIDMEVIENSLGNFDRITLYRTIKTFLEKGLIHEINLHGVKKYALCDQGCGENHVHHHDHVHFKCRVCNEVFCIDIPEMPQISIPNYTVEETEIQLTGICKSCKKK